MTRGRFPALVLAILASGWSASLRADGTNREAKVPAGKDGWGEERDVEYDWAGMR